MNIYICADMEGISGIGSPELVDVNNPRYHEGRLLLTLDVNACAEGCFDAGAKRVTVMDAHHSGSNLIIDKVHPKLHIVQGKGSRGRMHEIAKYDALILLGYHAMAGTPEAFIDHTMSPKTWQNCWLNGKKAGELSIDAAIAADEGVPTIMATGDDKLCKEARNLIPGIRTATVKYSSGRYFTTLLPLEEAHSEIREKAAEACRSIRTIKPFPVKKLAQLKVEITQSTDMPSVPANFTNRKLVDNRTVEVTAPTVREALYRLLV